MRVRIHETRTKRRIAKVDNACVAGNLQVASCVNNFVVLYDDDPVLQERVRFTIKHSRSFEHN